MSTISPIMNTYGTRSTTLVKGEGAYVWDIEGRRYLDAISGIAVCGLGHCHPAVTEAISQQASTLLHCSNLYNIEPQQQLGERLIELSGMDTVFFSNSGAEANEAAIKIARKFGQLKGIENPTIITANGSFHGRTMATLSATANPKVKDGFAPLLSGFKHVDYNSIDAIRAAADDNTVAIMVEPVQGEGGVNIGSNEYIEGLKTLCDANDWLLILDEIQTGNGRTGSYFAYQQTDIVPDVLTTAKGLGNGMPIGACLARGKAAEILQPGNHGSTFGGNPLATRAALAVVETLTTSNIIENAKAQAQAILGQFQKTLADNEHIVDIRAKGMMFGVELDRECGALVERGKEKGLLINVTAGKTIRLLPPLILDEAQADELVRLVCELITEFYAEA